MFRLTVSLGLVLGLGAGLAVVAAGVCAPSALQAAPDQAEDPVADWNRQWDKALKDAAETYGKVAKTFEKNLEQTSANTRRLILRYLPDDDETRKFLGYVKAPQKDGTTRWEVYDAVHSRLAEMTDLDDPKLTKFGKTMTESNKKVAGWFSGLAKKAIQNAAAKDASPAGKWDEKSQRAWERVLQVDDGNEEAHKALKHQKYESKYVSPFKMQFLQARDARKKLGAKENATKITPVAACEPDGMFVSAGLTGGGAKSAHIAVLATHGKDVAARLAGDCEKAMNDVVEVYGFPDTIKERLNLTRFDFVKNEVEWRQFLTKGAGWKDAEVTKYIEHHLGGTGVNGEYVTHTEDNAAADDLCMNLMARAASDSAQGAARIDLNSSIKEGVEEWLSFSIGYDVSSRVLGTKLTVWGAFGRYGDAVDPRPGEDKWIELARRFVESDDDVPISKLPKLRLENRDFKAPQTVKGYALLQFLFERDADKAKKFVWHALANGTPKAIFEIYPDNPDSPDVDKSMQKLDDEYREWVTKAT